MNIELFLSYLKKKGRTKAWAARVIGIDRTTFHRWIPNLGRKLSVEKARELGKEMPLTRDEFNEIFLHKK